MRGSPLIRAVLVIAALLLALIPLWKLTHAADVVMAPVSKPLVNVSVHMELTFSQTASSFQILYLGKVIWEGQNSAGPVQKDVEMHFRRRASIYRSRRHSPIPAPIPRCVSLSPPTARDPIEKTAWGQQGSVDDVLTFQEKN